MPIWTVLTVLLLGGCTTAPKIKYPPLAYKEMLFKLTYEYLRSSECRRNEFQSVYEVCGKSYYRDYAYYQQIRRDFISQGNGSNPW